MYTSRQVVYTVGHCTLTYHQLTYTYSILLHLVFPLHIGKVPAPFPCLGTNNNHEWPIALLWIPFWDCVSTRIIGERQKHRPGVGTLRSSFRKLHNSGTLWNQWPVALFWWWWHSVEKCEWDQESTPKVKIPMAHSSQTGCGKIYPCHYNIPTQDTQKRSRLLAWKSSVSQGNKKDKTPTSKYF